MLAPGGHAGEAALRAAERAVARWPLSTTVRPETRLAAEAAATRVAPWPPPGRRAPSSGGVHGGEAEAGVRRADETRTELSPAIKSPGYVGGQSSSTGTILRSLARTWNRARRGRSPCALPASRSAVWDARPCCASYSASSQPCQAMRERERGSCPALTGLGSATCPGSAPTPRRENRYMGGHAG
jgi:hypothetical protein